MSGRNGEIAELEQLYNSGKPEFVVIYGRKRTGKTSLIDQVFKGKYAFRHIGLSPVEIGGLRPDALREKQLRHFYNSLVIQGMKKGSCPADWLGAFRLLQQYLEDNDKGERLLVFFDEFPWLDTDRSGFLEAFEEFWDGWGSSKSSLFLVVCGSATPWITEKMINEGGALSSRVTHEIRLSANVPVFSK